MLKIWYYYFKIANIEVIYMFLCIDPGSKYIGYTLIKNNLILAKGWIDYLKDRTLQELEEVITNNEGIDTVLIEKGEPQLRTYELAILAKIQEHNLKYFIFLAKDIRKKLKLERHPCSLAIKAKEELIKKKFPHLILEDTTIHELDSILLFLFYQRQTA